MRAICAFPFLCMALTGCETLIPAPTPIRVATFSPSTFCKHMTVIAADGSKQCRVSYVKEDTPYTVNQIEDTCARWQAACRKGKGK